MNSGFVGLPTREPIRVSSISVLVLGDFDVFGVQTSRSTDFQVWSWIGVAGFVISCATLCSRGPRAKVRRFMFARFVPLSGVPGSIRVAPPDCGVPGAFEPGEID